MEVVQFSCIFCLEPAQKPKPAGLTCPCKFEAHEKCWKKWERAKGHTECPICHFVSTPNPLVVVVVTPETETVQTVRLVVNPLQVAYCSAFIVFLAILIWASTYNRQ